MQDVLTGRGTLKRVNVTVMTDGVSTREMEGVPFFIKVRTLGCLVQVPVCIRVEVHIRHSLLNRLGFRALLPLDLLYLHYIIVRHLRYHCYQHLKGRIRLHTQLLQASFHHWNHPNLLIHHWLPL